MRRYERGRDGTWHDGLLMDLLADELTRDFGWGWVPQQRSRSAEPKWEVDGVGKDLRDEFSRRLMRAVAWIPCWPHNPCALPCCR